MPKSGDGEEPGYEASTETHISVTVTGHIHASTIGVPSFPEEVKVEHIILE